LQFIRVYKILDTISGSVISQSEAKNNSRWSHCTNHCWIKRKRFRFTL